MGTIATLTVGLIIWIVLWANGVGSFDAFLVPFFMLMIAVTLRMVMPYVRERFLP